MSVAVLGAGQWGINLVREFYKLGALTAVVEPDESKHSSLKQNFPNVAILSTRENLPGVKAVAIATPVASHFQDVEWALQKGYDVFVEKPMVASLEQARALGNLLAASPRILMVGHLLLYQPAIRWIDSFLKEQGLGEIVSIHQRRLNHGKIRTQENSLWSLGVHDIAVLLHLLKKAPTAVEAFGHAYYQAGIEDEVTLRCRFGAKLSATLEVSWTWPFKERSLTIIGTKGSLFFDELKQTVTLYKKTFSPSLGSQDQGSEVVFEQKEEALPFELSHFLDCVKTRKAPLSDYQNGLAVLSVLEQANIALEKCNAN